MGRWQYVFAGTDGPPRLESQTVKCGSRATADKSAAVLFSPSSLHSSGGAERCGFGGGGETALMSPFDIYRVAKLMVSGGSVSLSQMLQGPFAVAHHVFRLSISLASAQWMSISPPSSSSSPSTTTTKIGEDIEVAALSGSHETASSPGVAVDAQLNSLPQVLQQRVESLLSGGQSMIASSCGGGVTCEVLLDPGQSWTSYVLDLQWDSADGIGRGGSMRLPFEVPMRTIDAAVALSKNRHARGRSSSSSSGTGDDSSSSHVLVMLPEKEHDLLISMTTMSKRTTVMDVSQDEMKRRQSAGNRIIKLLLELASAESICGTTDLSLVDAKFLTSSSSTQLLLCKEDDAKGDVDNRTSRAYQTTFMESLREYFAESNASSMRITRSVPITLNIIPGGGSKNSNSESRQGRRYRAVMTMSAATSARQAPHGQWVSEFSLGDISPISNESEERHHRRHHHSTDVVPCGEALFAWGGEPDALQDVLWAFSALCGTADPNPSAIATGLEGGGAVFDGHVVDLSSVPLSGQLVPTPQSSPSSFSGRSVLRPQSFLSPVLSGSTSTGVSDGAAGSGEEEEGGTLLHVVLSRPSVEADWGIRFLSVDDSILEIQMEGHSNQQHDDMSRRRRRTIVPMDDELTEYDNARQHIMPREESRRRVGITLRPDSTAGRQAFYQLFATIGALQSSFPYDSTVAEESPFTTTNITHLIDADSSSFLADAARSLFSLHHHHHHHHWNTDGNMADGLVMEKKEKKKLVMHFSIEMIDLHPVSSRRQVKDLLLGSSMLHGSFVLRCSVSDASTAAAATNAQKKEESKKGHVNKVVEAVWRKLNPSEKWGVKFHDGTLLVAACAAGTPCGRAPPPLGSLLHSINSVEVSNFAQAAAALQGKDEVRARFIVPCKVLLQKSTPQEPLGLAFPADQTAKPNPLRVPEGTPADRAGFPAGALIVTIEGRPVRDVKSSLLTITGLQERLVSPGIVVEFISPVSDWDHVEHVARTEQAMGAEKDAAVPAATALAASASSGLTQQPEMTQVPMRPFTEVTLAIDKSSAGKDATLGITFNRSTGEIRTVNTHGLIYKGLEAYVAESSASSVPVVTPPPGQWLVGMFLTHVSDRKISFDGSEPGHGIAQLIQQQGSSKYFLRLASSPLPAAPKQPPVAAPTAADATAPSSFAATDSDSRKRSLFPAVEQPRDVLRPSRPLLLQPPPVPTVEFLLREAVATLSSAAQETASRRIYDWVRKLNDGLIFDAKDLYSSSSDTAAMRPETGVEGGATASVISSATQRLVQAGVPPTVIERMCPFGDDSLHCLGWTRRCIVNMAVTSLAPPPPPNTEGGSTVTSTSAPRLIGGGYGTLLVAPVDLLGEDGKTVVAAKGTVVIATTRRAMQDVISSATSSSSSSSGGAADALVTLEINRLGARTKLLSLQPERPPAASPTSSPSASGEASDAGKEAASSSSFTVLQAAGSDLVLLVPPAAEGGKAPDDSGISQGTAASRGLKYGAHAILSSVGDKMSAEVGFSPFGGRVRYQTPLSSTSAAATVVEGSLELDAAVSPGGTAVPPVDALVGAPLLFHSRVAGIVLEAMTQASAQQQAAPPAASTKPAKEGKKSKKEAKAEAEEAAKTAAATAAPVAPLVVVPGRQQLKLFPLTSLGTTRFRQVLRAAVKF